jgi:hypothetical protein
VLGRIFSIQRLVAASVIMSTILERRYAVFYWATAGLAVFAIVAAVLTYEDAARKERRQWVSERKQWLTSGKTDHLYFYDTDHTDERLAEFAGMPEVIKLGFELTDLTDDGVEPIVSLPNLNELMLYGGRPRVGDKGLATLSGCQELETLKLINIDVTDRGLDALTNFPKLRRLTLFFDAKGPAPLTANAVIELRHLRNLETLRIHVEGMNSTTLSELQAALPNCQVSAN